VAVTLPRVPKPIFKLKPDASRRIGFLKDDVLGRGLNIGEQSVELGRPALTAARLVGG